MKKLKAHVRHLFLFDFVHVPHWSGNSRFMHSWLFKSITILWCQGRNLDLLQFKGGTFYCCINEGIVSSSITLDGWFIGPSWILLSWPIILNRDMYWFFLGTMLPCISDSLHNKNLVCYVWCLQQYLALWTVARLSIMIRYNSTWSMLIPWIEVVLSGDYLT